MTRARAAARTRHRLVCLASRRRATPSPGYPRVGHSDARHAMRWLLSREEISSYEKSVACLTSPSDCYPIVRCRRRVRVTRRVNGNLTRGSQFVPRERNTLAARISSLHNAAHLKGSCQSSVANPGLLILFNQGRVWCWGYPTSKVNQ